MTSYQQGETVPVEVKFYDRNNNLIDPDTYVITIKDPEGTTIIDEEIMIRESLGTYTYNYNLSDTAIIGMWKIIVKAISATVISIRNGSFRVVL